MKVDSRAPLLQICPSVLLCQCDAFQSFDGIIVLQAGIVFWSFDEPNRQKWLDAEIIRDCVFEVLTCDCSRNDGLLIQNVGLEAIRPSYFEDTLFSFEYSIGAFSAPIKFFSC